MLAVAAKVENCFTYVSENSFEISRWMIGKVEANLMPPRSYHANLQQEDLEHTKGNVLRQHICLLCASEHTQNNKRSMKSVQPSTNFTLSTQLREKWSKTFNVIAENKKAFLRRLQSSLRPIQL